MSKKDKLDHKDDISPDSLMGDFRGRGLIPIVILTVVVHAVVFGGTSIGYLKDELMGPATEKMSQEEKVDAAVKDATVAIREIAETYGISPQEVSERFSAGGPRASKVAGSGEESDAGSTKATPTTPPMSIGTTDAPEDARTKSDYEKSLETVAPAPKLPNLEEKEEEDLF